MKTYVCWLQRRQDKDNNKQLWVWIDTKGDERTLKFSTWLNSASQKIPYCWLLIWKSRCIAISFFLSTPLIHPEGKWYHLFMLPIDTHFLQLKMCVSKILFRAQLCIRIIPDQFLAKVEIFKLHLLSCSLPPLPASTGQEGGEQQGEPPKSNFHPRRFNWRFWKGT